MQQKRLKIGFVFDDSLDRNDGVQQYITTVGEWLRTQGHDVQYLVGETSDTHPLAPYTHTLSRNVKVKSNQNTLSIPLPARKDKIKILLKKQKYDILHVQMPYSPFMAGRVIAHANTSTAIVGTFHIVGAGRAEVYGARLLAKAQKKSLKHIDTLLAVSAAASEFAQRTFSIQTQISPNVVNVKKFTGGKVKKSLRPKKFTITFLGRLVERKGCEHLLRALSILNSKDMLSQVHVNICGDGPLRTKLEDYAQRHGLSDTVTFRGYIKEEEKSDYLASSDIAVFPSTGGESFGIVLIEAMAATNPVVLAGNNVGYSTVMEGSEQLFDPLDHAQLAECIETYITDDEARKKAITWQSKRIKQFDVAFVGPQLVDIYREAILAVNTRNDYTSND